MTSATSYNALEFVFVSSKSLIFGMISHLQVIDKTYASRDLDRRKSYSARLTLAITTRLRYDQVHPRELIGNQRSLKRKAPR
ncbi:MAG: hypothetical protein JRN52_03960 [Nitrososphaerota archaeon]|nr:hypothetical protein [Nitrososphaerota archaeon]